MVLKAEEERSVLEIEKKAVPEQITYHPADNAVRCGNWAASEPGRYDFSMAFLLAGMKKSNVLPFKCIDATNRRVTEKWLNATRFKLDGLDKLQARVLVERPEGRTDMGTKLLYDNKRDRDGRVTPYKTLLAAGGFHKFQAWTFMRYMRLLQGIRQYVRRLHSQYW